MTLEPVQGVIQNNQLRSLFEQKSSQYAEEYPGFVSIAVYGSQIYGAKVDSDVDVGLVYDSTRGLISLDDLAKDFEITLRTNGFHECWGRNRLSKMQLDMGINPEKASITLGTELWRHDTNTLIAYCLPFCVNYGIEDRINDARNYINQLITLVKENNLVHPNSSPDESECVLGRILYFMHVKCE